MTEQQALKLKQIKDEVIEHWDVQKALQLLTFDYELSSEEIDAFIERIEK